MKERQIDPLCPRLVAMGMETGQEDQVFFQFDPPPVFLLTELMC